MVKISEPYGPDLRRLCDSHPSLRLLRVPPSHPTRRMKLLPQTPMNKHRPLSLQTHPKTNSIPADGSLGGRGGSLRKSLCLNRARGPNNPRLCNPLPLWRLFRKNLCRLQTRYPSSPSRSSLCSRDLLWSLRKSLWQIQARSLSQTGTTSPSQSPTTSSSRTRARSLSQM